MEKSIIIIGGGMAGLSAGCYGQMNGYNTRIFEMHTIPGGLCTSWKREGFTIDACIHWLIGSGPGNDMYRIWSELGALQNRTILNHEEFMRIEVEEKALIIYTNADRLRQHMLELAPQDSKVINEFTSAIKACSQLNLPMLKAPELYTIVDIIKMGFSIRNYPKIMRRWNNVTVQNFGERFTDPFLRKVFPYVFNFPDSPMQALLFTLAWMHQKSAGYPIGGSLEFARAVEKRYLTLGGAITYKARVEKILVENDRAVGVKLTDGTEHRADIVISAADGHATIFDMLEGKYVDDKVKGYYDTLPIFSPLIYMALGVKRSFAGMPHSIMYILDKPLIIGGEELSTLNIRIHHFDPTFAPQGKTVITVMIESDYEEWKKLYEDKEQYEAAKAKIASIVIEFLDRRFPGLAAQIEMTDVATPITWERFTGNWKGSFEGWLPTQGNINTRMSKTLPGLSQFYMVGQWVEPGGGLPPAAFSGRHIIQMICKQDKRKFVTSTP